jgi:hypothetical protein
MMEPTAKMISMNVPHSLVKTVEAALTKEMVTLAHVLMDMMDLTVKMMLMNALQAPVKIAEIALIK